MPFRRFPGRGRWRDILAVRQDLRRSRSGGARYGGGDNTGEKIPVQATEWHDWLHDDLSPARARGVPDRSGMVWAFAAA
ncbi:hypothetical protein AA309_27510 [Microvirga vignae]|uniref:Uncharacterized protein n=1 Tax=Microvirga vignae TaxID=1225564 RepID=A0A0H1R5J6_9HYPH|nr:hypothetical protein [Microvirga vignae]KLK90106.1 hypothetical protein AA309_27510 [Microvirga vignae]